MANVISKLTSKVASLHIFNSIDHNCYEAIHSWDPSCTRVSAQVMMQCMKSGCMIYLPIYLLPQLLAIKWTGRRNNVKIQATTGNQNNNSNYDCNNNNNYISDKMKSDESGDQENQAGISDQKKESATKDSAEGGRKCDEDVSRTISNRMIGLGNDDAAAGDAGQDSSSLVHDVASPDLMREIAARLGSVAKQTVISAFVFAVNTSLIISLTCIQNHVTGKVFYFSPFLSSLVSHYYSFKYEKDGRRNSLTMFVLKSCFEVFYNMTTRTMMRDPGNGTGIREAGTSKNEKVAAVLLFSSSLALNFWFMNRNSSARDPLIAILSFIVGPEQERGRRNAGKEGEEGAGVTQSLFPAKVRGGRGGGEERNFRETNSSQEQENDHQRDRGAKQKEEEEESMPSCDRQQGSGRSCGDEGCLIAFPATRSSVIGSDRRDDSCEICSQSVIHKESRAGNQGMQVQEDPNAQGVSVMDISNAGGRNLCNCNHLPHDAPHDAGHSSAGVYPPFLAHGSPRLPSSSPSLSPSGVPPSSPFSCRHALLTVTSCPSYALTGSVHMFMIGWAIQVSLNLFKKRKHVFRSGKGPLSSSLQEILFPADSFKFALFLANTALIYRSSSCALRHLTKRIDDPINRALSGFMSGMSMFFFPSTQIALHTFWKTMFTMFFMEFGHTKRSQAVLDTLFVVMDSILINCMVMESPFVPKSYLRLIDSFTGSYLRKFNSVTLFHLSGGRDNSFRYELPPELIADHVSKRYMETIASWSLESA